MNKADFAIVDLETTGMARATEEIVEVAVVLVDSTTLELTGSYHTLVKPLERSTAKVSHVHRITDEMLTRAPSFAEIAPTLQHLLSGRKIVGQNILSFDLPFLNNAFVQHGQDYVISREACVDTLVLARKFLKLPNHKLATIAEHFNVSLVGTHAAIADTEATARIFAKMYEDSRVRQHTYINSTKICDVVQHQPNFSNWYTRDEALYSPW